MDMKRTKLTFLFSMLMSMVGVEAFAHDIEVANSDGKTIYYTYQKNNTELAVSCRGENGSSYSDEYFGNVVIPESVTYNDKTYPVTCIGEQAFFYCSNLTNVSIPNTVTKILDTAFSGCSSLTNVKLSSNLMSISYYAFENCSSLANITIPEKVDTIDLGAFCGCSSLTSLIIPANVKFIGIATFRGCSGLSSIIVDKDNTVYDSRENCNAIIETATNALVSGCKETYIPHSVTSIVEDAFAECSGLISITIPESVTSIGVGAFGECSSLASIEIPNSVTSVGIWAFDGTAWYNKQPKGLIYANKVAYKYKGTMRDNTSISLKEGTLCIADYAFHECSGLISIAIPNSVTNIGACAFAQCSGLTSVTIPESVTSIGHAAFSNCI